MNKTNLLTLLIIAILFTIAAASTYIIYVTPNDKANSEAQKSLTTSTEKVFTDLQGVPIDFKDYEGKVRVVNSWASWSPFSAQELIDLELLASEYKGTEVVVIAVNRKEPKEQARAFLESIKTFEHIIFAIDLTDSFYNSTGGFSMPETVFYDAKGTVVFHQRGQMSLIEMKKYLDEILTSKK